MLKLLKNMRRKEVLMVLLCTVLVAVQVYFDLRLPDYMTDLTTLIKTSGATADILSVGVKMLGCTLASAVLAVGCGYLAAKAASGFSFTVREKLFRHVMDIGSEEMQEAAELYTQTNERESASLEDQVIQEDVNASPVVMLVNSLVEQAVRQRASDIHVESEPDKVRVRCRVDGVLYTTATYDLRLLPAIVARIKILSNLDISGKAQTAGRPLFHHGGSPGI